MRVLLVTHLYPPIGVAGVERLVEQTAHGLTERGHEVVVLTRHASKAPPTPRLQRTKQAGVNVIVIAGGGPLLGRFPEFSPELERLFEMALIEYGPDVVVVSHLLNHSPGYVAIAHRWRVPVVLELHDFFTVCERAHLERSSGDLCEGPEGGGACAMHCFPRQKRAIERWALRTELFRHALERADALVAPSRFVADYFRQNLGPQAPPLYVLGNGVGFESAIARSHIPTIARQAGAPLHLACVGAVTAHKGVQVLIDAIRSAHLPKVRVTLIGGIDPGYFRSIAAAADRLSNVEFRAYGRFAPRELPFLLADVDAVVIPSLVWETYSIVARESLACGVPVIASRIGALPEAVRDGENGLLFEPGSASDLARLLRRVHQNPGLLDALRRGIRASDWISVEDRTPQLEAILHDLVATPLPPAATADLEALVLLRERLLEPSANR